MATTPDIGAFEHIQLTVHYGSIASSCVAPVLLTDRLTVSNAVIESASTQPAVTTPWRPWIEFIGIIRDISISGPNISYKCEISASGITTSDSTLVVRNAAVASATSGLSIVQLDGNTVLAPHAAAVTLDAPAITLGPGADTELYAEHDAMEITAEVADINAHWIPYNATITSATDAGGGSTYVGLIVRGAASGDAYVHSSHIADLVLGTTYDFSMKYNYPIGYAYCTLRLYQVVGSLLTQVGATRTLSQDTWTTLPFSLTAIATGPLQARLSFAVTGSEEWDELRIDQISIKP